MGAVCVTILQQLHSTSLAYVRILLLQESILWPAKPPSLYHVTIKETIGSEMISDPIVSDDVCWYTQYLLNSSVGSGTGQVSNHSFYEPNYQVVSDAVGDTNIGQTEPSEIVNNWWSLKAWLERWKCVAGMASLILSWARASPTLWVSKASQFQLFSIFDILTCDCFVFHTSLGSLWYFVTTNILIHSGNHGSKNPPDNIQAPWYQYELVKVSVPYLLLIVAELALLWTTMPLLVPELVLLLPTSLAPDQLLPPVNCYQSMKLDPIARSKFDMFKALLIGLHAPFHSG